MIEKVIVNALMCIQVIVINDDAAFHATATCAGPHNGYGRWMRRKMRRMRRRRRRMYALCDTVFVYIDAAAFAEAAWILSRGLRAEHKIATKL